MQQHLAWKHHVDRQEHERGDGSDDCRGPDGGEAQPRYIEFVAAIGAELRGSRLGCEAPAALPRTLGKPLLDHRQPVIAPKRLAVDEYPG